MTYYKISEERLKELIAAELELSQLEADGVDNWLWYGEGREAFFYKIATNYIKNEEELEMFIKDAGYPDLAELELKNYIKLED